MDRFIIKPQEPDIFMNMLKEMLEEKYTVKQEVTKPLGEEMEFLRRHNEGLFKKLEKKMSDLEIANQKLKILEEQCRMSFENVSDVIFTIDTNLNFLSMSPSVEKILGYKPKDFVGRFVSELEYILTPESFEQAIADISLVLKGKITSTTTYRFIAKDGTIKYGEISGSPLMRQGKIIGIISVARITERKQAEEYLKAREEEYRLIAENATESISITQEGRIKFVNPGGVKILGYPPEVLTSKPFIEFIHPDDREMVMDNNVKRMRGEEVPLVYPFRVIRRDGVVRWVEAKTVVVPWKEKPATLNFLCDITDRKKAEGKLRESEEKLRKAVRVTLRALVMAVETKDPYAAGHQQRVSILSGAIAEEMGLPQEMVDCVRLVASIYEIGKISTPTEIWSKPSKMSAVEFSMMKTHSQKGYELLKDVDSPWPLSEIVYQHHERLNGSGYPRGLKGESISLEARILMVADVVEAMVSNRPYRFALSIDAALEEIEKNKGILYDPEVVEVCLRLFREKGFMFE